MEDYASLAVIGEGTYGVVAKCRHLKSGRLVAVKRFRDPDSRPHVRTMVLREVRILKSIRHPNIVSLVDVFRQDGHVYMVLDYVDGTVLHELQRRPSGLPLDQVKSILWQLLRALQHLHELGTVHRDIKPENLLLSRDGVLKLCDFGFARRLHERDEADARYTDYVATRWYRAPELLVGNKYYDAKAVDVWALGVMLPELCTGKPLFPGKTDIDQLHAIARCCGQLPEEHEVLFRKKFKDGVSPEEIARGASEEQRLSRRLASLHPHIRSIVEAALDYQPHRRPTCAQLLQHEIFGPEFVASMERSLCGIRPVSRSSGPARIRSHRTDEAWAAFDAGAPEAGTPASRTSRRGDGDARVAAEALLQPQLPARPLGGAGSVDEGTPRAREGSKSRRRRSLSDNDADLEAAATAAASTAEATVLRGSQLVVLEPPSTAALRDTSSTPRPGAPSRPCLPAPVASEPAPQRYPHPPYAASPSDATPDYTERAPSGVIACDTKGVSSSRSLAPTPRARLLPDTPVLPPATRGLDSLEPPDAAPKRLPREPAWALRRHPPARGAASGTGQLSSGRVGAPPEGRPTGQLADASPDAAGALSPGLGSATSVVAGTATRNMRAARLARLSRAVSRSHQRHTPLSSEISESHARPLDPPLVVSARAGAGLVSSTSSPTTAVPHLVVQLSASSPRTHRSPPRRLPAARLSGSQSPHRLTPASPAAYQVHCGGSPSPAGAKRYQRPRLSF